MDGSLGRIWLRWVVLIVLGTGCRQNSLTEAWTKARASSCEVRVGYSLKDFSIEPDGDDSSYGTCVVWRGDWVVTARHVVKNLDRVFIVDANGVVHRPDLLVRDPFADIAVIRVPGLDAPAVTLSREKLAVGQSVFAVGFARGFTMSMSAGIISGLHLASVEGLNDSIQIDAQLNGGNSGGGVFDARGDLIAIANQSLVKADSTPGISWAIELSIVEFSANAMIEKGAVSYSVPIQDFVMRSCRTTVPELERHKLEQGRHCIVITADAPPFLTGDQVIEVRGSPVVAQADLKRRFAQGPPGEPVPVVVRRMGVRTNLEVPSRGARW